MQRREVEKMTSYNFKCPGVITHIQKLMFLIMNLKTLLTTDRSPKQRNGVFSLNNNCTGYCYDQYCGHLALFHAKIFEEALRRQIIWASLPGFQIMRSILSSSATLFSVPLLLFQCLFNSHTPLLGLFLMGIR